MVAQLLKASTWKLSDCHHRAKSAPRKFALEQMLDDVAADILAELTALVAPSERRGIHADSTWLGGRLSRLLVAKDSQQYLTLLAQDADQILRLAGCFLFNRGISKLHRFDIHTSNFRIHFYDTDAVDSLRTANAAYQAPARLRPH